MISVRWVGMFHVPYLEWFLTGWDENFFQSRASYLHNIRGAPYPARKCQADTWPRLVVVGGGINWVSMRIQKVPVDRGIWQKPSAKIGCHENYMGPSWHITVEIGALGNDTYRVEKNSAVARCGQTDLRYLCNSMTCPDSRNSFTADWVEESSAGFKTLIGWQIHHKFCGEWNATNQRVLNRNYDMTLVTWSS